MIQIDLSIPLVVSKSVDDYCDEARNLIRKYYNALSREVNEIGIKPLTLGLTNLLFKADVQVPSSSVEQYMIRVFGSGTGCIVDRARERRVLAQVDSDLLKCTFNNGVILRFELGECLRPNLIAQEKYQRLIAKCMAKLHLKKFQIAASEEKIQVWDTLYSWVEIAKTHRPDLNITLTNGNVLDWLTLEKELDTIRRYIEEKDYDVVCCHNDINAENCIYDETTDIVTFVDYEYASLNYKAFDIGNHFCEYAGVATNLDFDHCYPTPEAQRPFLESYFNTYYGREPTKEDLNALFDEVNTCSQISNLFWAVWGVIQHSISTLSFDFLKYGEGRFREYFKRGTGVQLGHYQNN